jgi:outer membrane receptor protein involved in Fe transport
VTESVTLTGGLNYTKDKKTVEILELANPDAFSALDLTTLAGGALRGLRGLQFRPPQLECPNVVESCKSDDDKVTWLARANWAMSDNLNVYVSTATGFKGTSWVNGDSSQPPRSLQAEIEAAGIGVPDQRYISRNSGPENSLVYELGLKTSFDKGYLNIAVFDQEIENFQTRGFDGVSFIATNAGKFSAQGVEFDLLYSPVPSWTFSLAGTYLDPIYDDYKNAPGPAGSGSTPIDRSGTKPGGIHPFSGVGVVTYNHSFSNGMDGYIRAEYLYESKAELTDAFPQIDREVNTVNASAGLAFNNNLSVQLWVRNLTDDIYFTGGFPGVAQGGTINSFYNSPRLWGGSITYEF